MEPKFDAGDIVKLRSGSPNMTCKPYIEPSTKDIKNGVFRGNYWCTWYDEGVKDPRSKKIHEIYLELVGS